MNQRKRTRVTARKEVSVHGPNGEVEGELENLSLKGCLLRLQTDVRVSSGDPVAVVIHLEHDAPELEIKVQGRVVRAEGGAMAIEFTEVQLESFPHLFRLVQYNADSPEQIEEELGTSAFTPTVDD